MASWEHQPPQGHAFLQARVYSLDLEKTLEEYRFFLINQTLNN